MGSQPIRIELEKILQENLAGKSCGKILQDRVEGEKAYSRKAVIGGTLPLATIDFVGDNGEFEV